MSESPVILHARVVTADGGGPEKTILNSPRRLAPHGYRALCAYMYPPGDPGFERLRHKARMLDAPLVGIEDRGPWDLRVVRELLRICRAEKVAIWHGHDYKSDAIGLLLRRFWPMKMVSTAHGFVDRSGRMPLYERVDLFCLRSYERVICVSQDIAEHCVAHGVPAKRCLVIENAIDTQQYARRQSTADAKARLGFTAGRTLIGAVGRLADEKNFAGLIRAVARLIDGGLDIELAIIGEGKQREELECLIAALNCRDRIRLLGYRTDTVDLYQAMDVFVLSSLREGLPNVLLEAMALQVPVVATRIAGVPRLVRDEANGLLVEPGDAGQLAEAVSRLFKDCDLRRRLGTAGRRTIEESYSFDARMAKVRAVYRELLTGQPHAAGQLA